MNLWFNHTFLWNQWSIKLPLDRSQASPSPVGKPCIFHWGQIRRMTLTHNQHFIYITSETQNYKGAFTKLHNHLKGGKSEISEIHRLSNYCFSHKWPQEALGTGYYIFSHNIQSSGHSLKAHSFHKVQTCYKHACICMSQRQKQWQRQAMTGRMHSSLQQPDIVRKLIVTTQHF